MNGEVCCILGICCPPNSAEQTNALAAELVKDKVCSENPEAHKVAHWVLKHFDLAPKGTVAPLVTEIARMARSATV
jgi:hypothetical protein